MQIFSQFLAFMVLVLFAGWALVAIYGITALSYGFAGKMEPAGMAYALILVLGAIAALVGAW